MKFDYDRDFARLDFRAHPELYQIGVGEQRSRERAEVVWVRRREAGPGQGRRVHHAEPDRLRELHQRADRGGRAADVARDHQWQVGLVQPAAQRFERVPGETEFIPLPAR